MSTRRVTVAAQPNASALQKELHALKSVAAPAADGVSAAGAEATTTAPSFDSLSGVEKSAASLGVHPDSWRPIGFMNNAHYDNLLKSNSLDNDLARRIDAYRTVAEASQ